MTDRGLGALAATLIVLLAALATGVTLTGVAVAAAGNVSVSTSPVTSSASVDITATADSPGNDLTMALDGDKDGAIQADEALGTVTTNASTGNGSLTATPGNVTTGDGDYTVYVVEEADGDGADDTAYPVASPGTFYDATATIEIDDTPPSITAFNVTSPERREVTVAFNASEELSDIDVDVAGPDAATLTESDFVSTGSGPYAYEATHHAAIDAEYTVRLTTAGDAAGNDGAGDEHATVIAATRARNATAVFDTGSTVYLGEDPVDVSPAIGDGPVTFRGVAGEADGRIVTATAHTLGVTAATGFVPGSWDADGDGTADLLVRDPAVTRLTLVRGTASGTLDVTDGYLQAGDHVTVSASFAFGVVDDLRVSVVDPHGVDVAPGMTADPAVLADGDDVLTLDTSGLDTGVYTVAVEAEALDANASASLDLVDRDLYVTLDRTRVVTGASVTATVIGPPDGTATVRIPASALDNRSTAASSVFERTGDVENRTTGGDAVGAAVILGRDGIARVRFDTGTLEAGRQHVSILEGTDMKDPADDRVPLEVAARAVSLGDVPTAAPINEVIEIRGHAARDATVKAYARIGGEWHPLEAESGWATDDAAPNGSFAIEVAVEGTLSYPGVYHVAVVDVTSAGYGDGEVLPLAAVGDRAAATWTLRTGVRPATPTGTPAASPTPTVTEAPAPAAPATPRSPGGDLPGGVYRSPQTSSDGTSSPVGTGTAARTSRSTTTPGQPGFGLTAAVVGLLALALLSRRRR